ncbi:CSLREA domain-containing protein, partial [Roseibium sp. RKSG952]|uniref:CSLREA domain-containing protein n=1 Tax=Roseibium sp. RKSG952 TaxID=2529384 RepID=UPI0012BC647E
GPLEEDARGEDRNVDALGVNDGSSVDAGAVELQVETPGLVVTTAADIDDPFDGETSLREAVDFANSLENGTEPDTITFDSTVFFGEGQPVIRLTEGELEITDAVIIDGSTSGLGSVTITGDALGNDLDAEGNTSAQGGSGITDVA